MTKIKPFEITSFSQCKTKNEVKKYVNDFFKLPNIGTGPHDIV